MDKDGMDLELWCALALFRALNPEGQDLLIALAQAMRQSQEEADD